MLLLDGHLHVVLIKVVFKVVEEVLVNLQSKCIGAQDLHSDYGFIWGGVTSLHSRWNTVAGNHTEQINMAMFGTQHAAAGPPATSRYFGAL